MIFTLLTFTPSKITQESVFTVKLTVGVSLHYRTKKELVEMALILSNITTDVLIFVTNQIQALVLLEILPKMHSHQPKFQPIHTIDLLINVCSQKGPKLRLDY